MLGSALMDRRILVLGLASIGAWIRVSKRRVSRCAWIGVSDGNRESLVSGEGEFEIK